MKLLRFIAAMVRCVAPRLFGSARRSRRSLLAAWPVVDTKRQTPYIWGTDVQFTPDQQALISDAIASGRLHRPEDAMQKALMLWEEREHRRLEILGAAELSKASLARGEGRTVTTRDEQDQLVSDITRRGMARLAAGQKSHE